MQAYLLGARRFRVTGKVRNFGSNDLFPIPTSNPTTTASTADPLNTIPPSSACSPDKHQLKYYSGLYSSNAANSFSGNIVYYALKAVETDKNRTDSAITASDNAIIANISDHSRFTPAGMETANKAVCAKILQEMDVEASLFSATALCAWDYICDYRADRYPHYLFKARCVSSECKKICSQRTIKHNMCQSHGIHLAILEMKDKCDKWVWSQELIPLACACTTDVTV